MSGARKFGTFSGVFTPSILTILGVIMYLRLPSIVGQAGLAATIGIILVAHVISVTTGLSVASVATDRKVRGGGTYYMLSRSLGLPIGGTLGIALFVGLSFAVSLYIIGFAESFLGFWGIETTKNAIRLTGAVVLLVVTAVTLISTSLALRAQFLILAAIMLSLLAILLGVGRHGLAPGTPADAALAPLPTAAPFIVLFGIFFPAVTGFEAGVSMSGDLRDPKKSIPIGTIAAIGVGLAVYVALAVFLAYTVDARQLASNPNVLTEISLWSPLVLAGVWGATISSALGSILAAPRIVQAVSIDRITPAIFGRGFGRDNEPRHALVLTFVIAAAGILIGELDAIARIVSMFFITAYGFLNLACAIESWASPDFRPSFRVPRLVPIAGALACLIVMIQLDLVAMIGATLVLGGLYLFLARRQLRLETGDAWSGFWAGVARAALHRLDRRRGHRRNWRPNVLAFALPGSAREPLLELARDLAGRRGILTAVDVVRGRSERVLQDTAAGAAGNPYGVFTRTVECRDEYACVADMSRYHGFAGVEPNALLLAWPATPDERFRALLADLAALDRNVLLLAGARPSAGRDRRIDVWWWDDPDRAALQLSLLRALATNDAWRTARVRVLTALLDAASSPATVRRQMAGLLEEMRVDADVHVIGDGRGAGDVVDLVVAESADADLVLIDADALMVQPRMLDVERAHVLGQRLRTTVITLPASEFVAESDRRQERARARPEAMPAPMEPAAPVDAAELPLPADPVLADAVARVRDGLLHVVDDGMVPLRDAYDRTVRLLERAHALADESLREAGGCGSGPRADRGVRRICGDVLYQSLQLLVEHRQRATVEQAAALEEFTDRLLGGIDTLPQSFEPALTIVRDRAGFRAGPDDDIRLRVYKLFRRAISWRRPGVRTVIPLRDIVRRHGLDAVPAAERVQLEFIAAAAAGVFDAQQLIASTRDALDRVAAATIASGETARAAESERAALRERATGVLARHRSAAGRAQAYARRGAVQLARRIARDLERVDAARRGRSSAAARRNAQASAARARELPQSWQSSQHLLIAGNELELTLLALRNRAGTIVARAREQIVQDIRTGIIARLRAVHAALETYIEKAAHDPNVEFTRLFEQWPAFDPARLTDELQAELRAATTKLPERIETLSPAAAGRMAEGLIDDLEVVTVALRPLVDYYIDVELLGPIQERLALVPDVFETATDAAQDAVRLAAFRIVTDYDEGTAGAPALMLATALPRIDAARQELERLADELGEFVDARFEHAARGLAAHRLLRDTSRLPQYIRARHGREALGWFREQQRRLREFAGEQTVRLIYQRSEATRFTRDLEMRSRPATSGLLDLVAAVSPAPHVLERVPYHYRQLFLGRPGFSRDFWTGWAAERRLAARAIGHHRSGFAGPLLVLGEPFAGKSALAHAIAEEHFEPAMIHRITPPRERSTRPELLLNRIAETVGAPAGAADPLLTVPSGSVIILDDLDRWWERETDGYGALDAALELMERHAGRCLFIASADVHAFRFIELVRPIRSRALAVVECRPFSAREIGDVIELRHGSTGLVFQLDGTDEDRLSRVARARLFHQFFEYAGGNIGAALHGWIAHITAVDGDRLRLARPVAPDLEALDRLDTPHKLVLVQLVLHRALPAERLMQLGGASPQRLAEPLADLRRVHAVIDDPHHGIMINPFLRPFVARRFTELELVP
ncbi:MAG TPA: amino acid permease [Longimicrobiales bacterium]